jgi:hypothetical protein
MSLQWWPYDFQTDAVQFLGPDATVGDMNSAVIGLRRMTWVPLADYYWGSKHNAFDQFLMKSLSFAPLGMILALPGARGRGPGSLAVIVVAMVVGLIVETGQYFIPSRHPSTTDLLIEGFGAWAAFAATRHAVAALRLNLEGTGSAHVLGC